MNVLKLDDVLIKFSKNFVNLSIHVVGRRVETEDPCSHRYCATKPKTVFLVNPGKRKRTMRALCDIHIFDQK